MLARPVLVILAVAAVVHSAAADPALSIHAGACPSAAAIESELHGVRVVENAPIHLEVEDVAGGARVRITSELGPSEIQLDGKDCAVLASAVAAIVDAWFVDLAPHRAAHTSPPTSPPSSSAPGTQTALAARVEPRPTAPRWSIALSRAYIVGASAANRIEVGWWPRRGWRLQGQLGLGDATNLGDTMVPPVLRSSVTAALTLGRRLGDGRLWLEARGGAAAVVSRVEVPMLTTVRIHAAGVAAVSSGVRLGMGASLRIDADAVVYPVRDIYTLARAAVARSPRAELGIGLGLEIAFGGRFW